MDKRQISWKKWIKYLQILFFIFIILWYSLYNYTVWVYNKYNDKLDKLDTATMKVKSIQDNMDKIKETTKLLKQIKENKGSFIDVYNDCYADYSLKKYNMWSGNIVSLQACIKNKYTSSSIDNFKDVDLENIWISFGIYKDKSDKMNFDQKRFLASLDQNIFIDDLEKRVPLLSFSNPVLIDKSLWLYKVSFTFTTSVSYTRFENIFNQMQNVLYKKNNLYYTIDSIWKFDIMNKSQEQKINIQWSFYFSR